jgi:hypothetical protein
VARSIAIPQTRSTSGIDGEPYRDKKRAAQLSAESRGTPFAPARPGILLLARRTHLVVFGDYGVGVEFIPFVVFNLVSSSSVHTAPSLVNIAARRTLGRSTLTVASGLQAFLPPLCRYSQCTANNDGNSPWHAIGDALPKFEQFLPCEPHSSTRGSWLID